MFKQKIIEKLEHRIKFTSSVMQNVMIDFQRIRQNFHERIDLCLQNGGYIEHLS